MSDTVTVGIGSRTGSSSEVAMSMGSTAMYCTPASARYYATALMLAADEVDRCNGTCRDRGDGDAAA